MQYLATATSSHGEVVTYLVNSSQGLAASYKYDAYGNLVSQSGSLAGANVYRFSSKEWLATPGLYYYGYRWYAPNLQRWPNRDPLGEAGFELLRGEEPDVLGDGPNLYIYGVNNPVTEIDALGLMGYDSHKAKKDCLKKGGTWASDAEMLYGGDVNACVDALTGPWNSWPGRFANGIWTCTVTALGGHYVGSFFGVSAGSDAAIAGGIVGGGVLTVLDILPTISRYEAKLLCTHKKCWGGKK